MPFSHGHIAEGGHGRSGGQDSETLCFLFTAAEAEQLVFFTCSCSAACLLLHQCLCLEIMHLSVLEDLLVLNLPQRQHILAKQLNLTWTSSRSPLEVKPMLLHLYVCPCCVVFNLLYTTVTEFNPTVEQGQTRVDNPGQARVRLAHVTSSLAS